MHNEIIDIANKRIDSRLKIVNSIVNYSLYLGERGGAARRPTPLGVG
jgi:hypothetical protein